MDGLDKMLHLFQNTGYFSFNKVTVPLLTFRVLHLKHNFSWLSDTLLILICILISPLNWNVHTFWNLWPINTSHNHILIYNYGSSGQFLYLLLLSLDNHFFHIFKHDLNLKWPLHELWPQIVDCCHLSMHHTAQHQNGQKTALKNFLHLLIDV